jgi:cardiolipin synthase
VKNVPNILSTIRIFLVPVFLLAYFCDDSSIKWWAAIVYALASLTDFLDGFIARKYQLITNLGKVLDPLGDKMMTFSVLVCITLDKVIPLWATLVFVVKELLMGLGGLIIHKKAKVEIPPSNFVGKASTVIFFIVGVTLMLFTNIPHQVATIMISVAIGIMLVALGSYIITFSGVMKAAKSQN